MSTNRGLLAVVLALMVVMSGCAGILGDLEFVATEAVVDDGTLTETGYELADRETLEFDESFEVAGQERTVYATSHLLTYAKAITIGGEEVGGSTVVVLSTPNVEVLGQSLNPLSRLSNEELIERALANADDVDSVERVGERTVTILGDPVAVTKYATTTTVEGEEIDVYIHIATVEHGDDVLVLVGMHPQDLDGESDDVDRMFGGVVHEG